MGTLAASLRRATFPAILFVALHANLWGLDCNANNIDDAQDIEPRSEPRRCP